MQLISKSNKEIGFSVCFNDIFSKYAWVISLKDKKGETITNNFQKILIKSKRKPNKILVDKGHEFCNTSMKPFLQNNDVEIYSAHNEGKFVTA